MWLEVVQSLPVNLIFPVWKFTCSGVCSVDQVSLSMHL
jgi:hypothetical protein